MKQLIILFFCITHGLSFATPASEPKEIWGYLYKGEERFFPNPSPLTDIACFSAQVDKDGYLSGGHTHPPKLTGTKAGVRYHLVVTMPWNPTLAHIYLNKDLPFRNRIIADIVKRSESFDGIQIDFESIEASDGTAYLNFLASVKNALPKEKLFSVAVMARWAEHKQKNPTDAFDYPFINRFADRVIVMAYDEHYRAGSAGPIASLEWCKKIYEYAQKTIDSDKLIMGIPLYGRSWQKQKLERSYRGIEIEQECQSKQIAPSNNPENGGFYSFRQMIDVTVHYETMESLEAKLNLYTSRPLRGVAFWRIGQEPTGFWNELPY